MPDSPVVVDLVTRAREGDESAWAALVHRYAPLVWAICRQFRLQDAECEDVGQTVWLGLVEALPHLREPAALPGWLATTTRRECLRAVEAARKRNSREVHVSVDIQDETLSPLERDVVIAELDAALRTAFAQLGRRCQQLLSLLMEAPRRPYTEISSELKIPVGSIGPTRARCLSRLRRSSALAAWIEAETGRRGGG